MNILSLFDGMACGMLAFQKTGIAVDNYYAYEIDKYAIKAATHNFPQIQECGDVFKADFAKYSNIDYLIGGSPCTYWSIAQSPDKRETTASGIGWELFSQYVRALHEAKPKFFIYENNKSMSKAIRESITQTFGFEPVCINSALVSAQNRQRLYWVGKRNAGGTYSKVDVEQPEDRGILLRDVLDGVEPINTTNDGKSQTLKAQYSNTNATNICCYKSTYGASGIAEPVACRCRGRTTKDGKGYAKYECREDNKSNTLDTNTTNGNMVAEPVMSSVQVGALPRPNGELSQSQAFRVYDTNAKSVTLKAGGGGAGGKTGLYAIPIESCKQLTENEMDYMVRGHSDRRWNHCQFDGDIPVKAVSGADGKTYTVYEVKDGNITIKGKTYPIKLIDGYYIIRKLTVSECKRLQTVPEWYEFPVSNTQAYKMLGNGWTVDVIVHLINATENT